MLNGGKELFYEKSYARIGINTNNDLPLNKSLKFPTLAVGIKYFFQETKLFSQIYLNKFLYKLYKCCNTMELMFQKELTLIKQKNHKNVCFVIIGILKIKF